jgi:primosomal replication protein N
VIETLQTGFGLVTGLINLLQLINTINSSAITTSTHPTIHCSTHLVYHSTVSSSGFQRQTFHFLWVPERSLCLRKNNSQQTPTQLLLRQQVSLSTKCLYTRGEQLFWLGGHFVEVEVGRGPHLLK